MTLSDMQRAAITVIVRSDDIGDRWRQCHSGVFDLLANLLPDELVEFDKVLKRVRLTRDGETLARWVC